MSLHTGEFEYNRFDNRRKGYQDALNYMQDLNLSSKEIIENYSIYSGHMTISRYLGLYELYKSVLGVAGHIAEVGTYKGASLLYFGKLIRIFEGESLTQVHGFDWFQGTGEDSIVNKVDIGSYKGDFEILKKLIEIQDLKNIAFVHKMDVTKELKSFLDTYRHFQFKIVFMDIGLYDVVRIALPLLWERLTPGGILILDQYNHELSPGETIALREILPNAKVKSLPNIWMPTAYIVKE